MKAKTKGWILAAIQFILFIIIAFSSALEYKYMPHGNIPAVHFAGIFLMLIAALVFSVTFVSFSQIITANPVPRDSGKLRTGGVYKFIRHPMYFSAILLSLGIALYFEAYISLIWIVLLFVFFMYKTNVEETHLVLKWPEYSEYKSKTKRIIPFIY